MQLLLLVITVRKCLGVLKEMKTHYVQDGCKKGLPAIISGTTKRVKLQLSGHDEGSVEK